MRIEKNGQTSHLSYCTNIHPAEQWDDVLNGLQKHVPAIRAAVSPEQPFGLGLRLASAAATTLQSSEARQQLLDVLKSTNSYVFTINGFPYGNFHGQRVKEGAYKPDWSEPTRLNYTNTLATLLSDIQPDDVRGSVSTVPGTFKPWAQDDSTAINRISENLIKHVAHLVGIKESTGKHITLALEPEPYCLLETIEETVDFFKEYLFSDQAIKLLQSLTGLNTSDSESAMHKHIGVCYDVCHAAVEYENAKDSVAALTANGIDITKLQLSSALRVANVTEAKLDALRPFAEPVYLHQVIQRSPDGTLTRFKDMDEALSTGNQSIGSEWRIHFHVPIFLDAMEHFDTTQNFLKDILSLQKKDQLSDHLEVETYTWDVLPEAYRGTEVSTAIAREINWVTHQLN